MPLRSKGIEGLSLFCHEAEEQALAMMSALQPGNHVSLRQSQQARPSNELNAQHFDAKIVVFISCVVSSYFSQVNMIALFF